MTDASHHPDAHAIAAEVAAILADQLGEARLIDAAELARRLGVAERTIRSMIARGQLPKPLPVGGSSRWDWPEVIQYLRARRDQRNGRHRRARNPRQPRGQGGRYVAIETD